MKFRTTALALIGLAFMSADSLAATVSFTGVLNLSTPGIFSTSGISDSGLGTGFSGVTPALVSQGDQVQIKYTFSGGQGLSASSVSQEWANIWDWNPNTNSTPDGKPQESVGWTGSFSFLDAAGHAIFTIGPQAGSGCCVHIGDFYNVAVGPIVFYGVEFDGTITSESVARTYNLPGLDLTGTNFAEVAAVPEPSERWQTCPAFCPDWHSSPSSLFQWAVGFGCWASG